jgi:hypothetical protein
MSILYNVKDALADPGISSKRQKLRDIGDFMEMGYRHRQDASNTELIQAVTLLVQSACQEKDDQFREEILWAISQAVTFHSIENNIDFDPFVTYLSSFKPNDLQYIIYCWGTSKHRKYLPLIKHYLNSSDESIKFEAENALKEFKEF